jgi:hypothetical protein
MTVLTLPARAAKAAIIAADLKSQPAEHDPPAFVLPPIRLDDLMRDHIGMNDRQTNVAWHMIICDREALRRFSGALSSPWSRRPFLVRSTPTV